MLKFRARSITWSIAASLSAALLASGMSTAEAEPPVLETPAAALSGHRAPLIVIDPGHSGKYMRSREPVTGLRDITYPNYPEIYETFDISICVARALKADGYRVILTKKHALDNVSLAARARVANQNKADLAISVHNDHGQGSRFQATYDQRGLKGPNGKYHAMYRGRGDHRTVFRLPEVAKKSQRYARIIAAERSTAQRHKVTVRENSFNGRAPLEPGNLAIVQLLAKVPWVYNEMGAKSGSSVYQATSIASEVTYARGLLAGVEAAIAPPSGADHPSAKTPWLRRCLTKQVEPSPGRYTRPRVYLPLGFA
jgi:N-acetylmuramoyl-L-alanine amidase